MMNAIRQPRSLKRRSSAMIVDEKEDVVQKLDNLDRDSPPVKREPSHKRRISRLWSTEHGYDPRKSPSLRIRPDAKFSPMRLGYLPPPVLNFDDSSESESDSEETEKKTKSPAKTTGGKKEDTLERGPTPRRPLAVARRLHFGIAAEEVNNEQKKEGAEEGKVQRRKTLPALHRTPRVRDVAELLQNM